MGFPRGLKQCKGFEWQVSSIDHGSGHAYGDLIMDQVCTLLSRESARAAQIDGGSETVSGLGGVAPQQCADLGLVAVAWRMADRPP